MAKYKVKWKKLGGSILILCSIAIMLALNMYMISGNDAHTVLDYFLLFVLAVFMSSLEVCVAMIFFLFLEWVAIWFIKAYIEEVTSDPITKTKIVTTSLKIIPEPIVNKNFIQKSLKEDFIEKNFSIK